jgi:endonuclease YncB( thermonuclease family)
LARKAKRFTVSQLRNAEKIELKSTKRGKHFRLLADVFVDGKNLAQLLIDINLARAYSGGTRQGWCEK